MGRMHSTVAVLALTAALGGAAPRAQAPMTWTIDDSHSAANFAVKHMMVSTVRGRLGKVSGTIQYDGKNLNTLQVEATIDVAGIDTDNEGRDKDLRSASFLESDKYPTITFKSKKVVAGGDGRFKLVGDLTIKATTKEVTLDVEGPAAPVMQKGRDGSVRQRIGASATTRINRKEYGVMYNSLLDSSIPVVADEVSLTIDVEAIYRPAPASGGH